MKEKVKKSGSTWPSERVHEKSEGHWAVGDGSVTFATCVSFTRAGDSMDIIGQRLAQTWIC